ncbi:YciI family protein [Roseateles sp.]|uniref:YciI family protein n=1 Tax=Roseateles sp. TaxID=1971397 RepID=UPI002F3FDB7B
MAKFITVGYGDEAGYQQTDAALRDAAHAHDAKLKAGGALIGIAGAPVQVRNPDDSGVQTTSGAYLHSTLPIAGFAVIEAKDMQEAIEMVSKTPCAVAHGVVEIWPLQEAPQ